MLLIHSSIILHACYYILLGLEAVIGCDRFQCDQTLCCSWILKKSGSLWFLCVNLFFWREHNAEDNFNNLYIYIFQTLHSCTTLKKLIFFFSNFLKWHFALKLYIDLSECSSTSLMTFFTGASCFKQQYSIFWSFKILH